MSTMTRDEVMARLLAARGEFDAKVAAVPPERLDVAPPGHTHSPKEIAAHVDAYEELITERLRAARAGETTAFDRDRVGWKEFNERVWGEARGTEAAVVLERSARVFAEMLAEIGQLTDAELNEVTGVTAVIDPAWLGKHTLGEIVGIDTFEHYPMHFEALDAACA
ncbi:MAG: hypothetical protein C0418_05245 [Coriobacteriaceae bacterium]|nr:hypothetical protein [Coriobacteriaceae bacterium]